MIIAIAKYLLFKQVNHHRNMTKCLMMSDDHITSERDARHTMYVYHKNLQFSTVTILIFIYFLIINLN